MHSWGGLWLVIATGLSGIDDAAEKREVVKSVAKINGLLRGPIYNLYGKDLKLTQKKKKKWNVALAMAINLNKFELKN